MLTMPDRRIRHTDAEHVNDPQPVAFYRRVSNDELRDKGTIENQLQYLHRRYDADLSNDAPCPMRLVADFADDGVGGAIQLGKRPEGKPLLEMARTGGIQAVIVSKLDRLGRTARVLLDAADELERCGVAIVSASEPFDTRQPIGRFVFQLLGSIAELERETIRERTSLGRGRVARTGVFLTGPVPFGYVVDVHGFLQPSDRLVAKVIDRSGSCRRAIPTRSRWCKQRSGRSVASIARRPRHKTLLQPKIRDGARTPGLCRMESS